MKRYAFPLTIILLLFAVIALAAPGDKRPAVTSAAIGLGSSSSPTLASVTATTSVTAPSFNSTAADGYHYVLPYNSVTFAGTASVGMFQTTPTGPKWFSGTEWESIGGGTWGSITGTLSAQTDLQAALNAKASTSYVDTAIAGVTAGTIPFVSDTAPPSAENTINYSRSDHKFRFRYPNGDVYASAAMTLETAADTTPAAFAFTDLTDVALSTTQTATPVQITGINYPTAVTATGGTAAICTGATVGTCGTFSASPGNVVLNQYVSAQHTSSGSNSTAVNTVVTIGGVSDTFTSTTAAGGAYTALFSNNFDCTDTGTVTSCSSPNTWSMESDANSLLSIASNKLVAYAPNTSKSGWVRYSISGGKSDIQATFDYALSAVTGLGASSFDRVWTALDSGATNRLFTAGIEADSSGNFKDFFVSYYNGAGSYITTTYNYTLVAGTSVALDIKAKASTTTTSADGSLSLSINGTPVIDLTGINTYTASAYYTQLGNVYGSLSGSAYISIDNFVLGYK